MPKLIDAFLFFQELDLLEIRLNYLYDHVDRFVILEAVQTFSGKPKPLVFRDNIKRFEKYLDKITYYVVEDAHQDYESVQAFLKDSHSETSASVLSIMDGHTHYNKKQLHWVLDTYHREMLHAPLNDTANNDDLVMFSDLDEIPSLSAIEEIKKKQIRAPIALKQSEFVYFVNFYNNSDWIGGIVAPYGLIRDVSFNFLRIDSKKTRSFVDKTPIDHGGFHFTNCGGIDQLKKKIESWSHQEFNTKYILSNIAKNVSLGRDIFGRESGTVLRSLPIEKSAYYDQAMAGILVNYPSLIGPELIVRANKFEPEEFFRKLRIKFDKLTKTLVERCFR